MNLKIQRIGCCLLLLPLFLTSCIRDELRPCPPLEVRLTVKDKNYFNVSDVPQETPKSESLAFRQYIPTLYYSLRDLATGTIVEEQGVYTLTGDDTTPSITFCECLPQGKYVLTVWGGLPDNTSLADNSLTSIIHKNAQEGSDIYLAHDTLTYDIEHSNFTINMERVTGKLVVEVDNLPSEVRHSDKSVSQIYERVTHQFNYLNPLTVSKVDTWQPATNVVTSIILAPSTDSYASMLRVKFYDTMPFTTPTLTPKDIYITLKRNELTVVKYVYNQEKDDFYIYLLLSDGWNLIYDLDID